MYTVRLLAIKCIGAQELEGDEIYIRFNGATVWSTWELKMHHQPHGHQFDEFDFEQGRLHDAEGWKRVEPFEAEQFIFPGQSGNGMFEVWDANRFLRDDFLGRAPVSAADAGRGHIQVVCAHDGAHYVLTYTVALE